MLEPTEKRKARAGSSLGKVAISAASNAIAVVKQWKIKNPIEQHGDKFPAHLRLALERFVEIWRLHVAYEILTGKRAAA